MTTDDQVTQQAEITLLGSCLVDPGKAVAAARAAGVCAAAFEQQHHADVWRAIVKANKNGGVDPLTVARECRASDEMKMMDGPVAFVTGLLAETVSAANAASAARLVVDGWRQRQRLEALPRIEAAVRNGEAPDRADLDLIRGRNGDGVTVCLADVPESSIDWLWFPRIPRGELTLLYGDGGVGKSAATLVIAAAVSLGAPLPGNDGGDEPGSVLLCSAEDSSSKTLRPRLEDMEADLNRVHVLNKSIYLDADGIDTLRAVMDRHRPRLVVMDPVVAFLPPRGDAAKAKDVRQGCIVPLSEIAHEYDAAVVMVSHTNKATGRSARHRAMDSADWINGSRSALLAGSDPNDPSRCGLFHVKANLGPLAEPLGYTLENGRFLWTGPTDLTEDRVLEPGTGKTAKKDEAADLLREMCGVYIPSADVIAEGERRGLNKRTVQRAADQHCERHRDGFGGVVHWRIKGADTIDDTIDDKNLYRKDLSSMEKVHKNCISTIGDKFPCRGELSSMEPEEGVTV